MHEASLRELFIYYRVKVEDAGALRVAALAWQAQLQAQHPELGARLLRRPDPSDGMHTWMEIYALPSTANLDGTAEQLQQDIETASARVLAGWIVGARHCEAFVTCAW